MLNASGMVEDVFVRDETRGQVLKRRRLALGFRSLREFARKVGIGRDTIAEAERDEPSVRDSTYEALDAALDRLEREFGMSDPDLITSTVEMTDPQGKPVRVTFQGTDPAGVADAVDKFLRSRSR